MKGSKIDLKDCLIWLRDKGTIGTALGVTLMACPSTVLNNRACSSVCIHDGKLYISSNIHYVPPQYNHDPKMFITSDMITFETHVNDEDIYSMCEHNGYIYAIKGNFGVYKSLDGINWTQTSNQLFGVINQLISIGNYLWIIEWRWDQPSYQTYMHYSSDNGVTFTQVLLQGEISYRLFPAIWYDNGKFYCAGGKIGNTYYNDVWSFSDFNEENDEFDTYIHLTSDAPWNPRYGAIIGKDNIYTYLISGQGDEIFTDGWRTIDFINWEQCNNVDASFMIEYFNYNELISIID